MASLHIFISLYFFAIINGRSESHITLSPKVYCPTFKNGPDLAVEELVGTWMTVYTQPKTVNCFTLQIRATTELEREQYTVKYGNFSSRVDWNKCYLEVESPMGKHYLEGNGTGAGLLRNIIVIVSDKGEYTLQDQNADQWTMFGRRGNELLLMRDCTGEAVAIFARAPYWPTTTQLYAILHRSGIASPSQERVLCQPLKLPPTQCTIGSYTGKGKN